MCLLPFRKVQKCRQTWLERFLVRRACLAFAPGDSNERAESQTRTDQGNAPGLVVAILYPALKRRNRMKKMCEIDFVPPFQGLNSLGRVSQGAALGCQVTAPSAPR